MREIEGTDNGKEGKETELRAGQWEKTVSKRAVTNTRGDTI
jgi:hypothetical protein